VQSPAPAEEDRTATGVLLRMQRGVGNHAAARAAESLRGRGRLLHRCFANLQSKLTSSSVSKEVKVVLPEDSSKRKKLDALWKSNMGATSPEEFVLRAVAGLSDLVGEHNRLYVHFDLLGETGVLFEVKFQQAVDAASRPQLPPGQPLTRGWQQIDARRWVRNVAGATRHITFDQPLRVRDERTDAPIGKEGGSGFTKQLFKNLLNLYEGASPATVLEITADEDGRYVWARYGFLPDDSGWKEKIRDPICQKVHDSPGNDLAGRLLACAKAVGKPISGSSAATMASVLQRDDARALLELLDVTEAKAFLWWLFTSGIVHVWKGTLDLQDSVQAERVRAYIQLPPVPQTPKTEVLAINTELKE
jgi:hypothetical protein